MVENQIVVYDAPIWTVYMHVNKINGKKYVGITSKDPIKRWGSNGHGYQPNKGKKNPFYNAIKKYGWDNFDHIILLTNISQSFADIMEQVLIKYFHTHISTDRGYNSNWGGFHGILFRRGNDSPNAKPVVCLNDLKKYGSIVEAQKITGIQKGKIGSVCRGDQKYTYNNDKIPVVFVFYDDYLKMSEEDIAYRLQDVRSVVQPVICINNLMIFDSPFEAAEYAGTNYDKIVRCCKSKLKTGLKEARRYCGKNKETGEWLSWMFLYDYNHLQKDKLDEILCQLERSSRKDIRTKPLYCLNSMEWFPSVKEAGDIIGLKSPSNISVQCVKKTIGCAGKNPRTKEMLNWIRECDYIKLSDEEKRDLIDKYYTGNYLLLENYNKEVNNDNK